MRRNDIRRIAGHQEHRVLPEEELISARRV
jgi:hypothetical protein